MSFDTVLEEEGQEYKVKLNPDGGVPENLISFVATPSTGYQLAALLAEDNRSALVYLRNAKGGIVNLGNGRPCYLRG